MNIKLPLFIVFEGIDGSGKSSIQENVYNHFKNSIPVIMLKEPTDGKWGKKIREILQGKKTSSSVELLELFIKDREDDVKNNIIPSLDKGMLVLMDRYYFSNAAYQGAMGINPDKILAANTAKNFPRPDRIFLIDIDPATAIERIHSRNTEKGMELFEKKSFLAKVNKIYNKIINDQFLKIDGALKLSETSDLVINDIERNFTLK